MSAEHVFTYAYWVWQEPSITVYFALLHGLLLLNQLYLTGAFYNRLLFWGASTKGEETVQFEGPYSH